MTAGNSLSENECFSRRKWTSTTLSSAAKNAAAITYHGTTTGGVTGTCSRRNATYSPMAAAARSAMNRATRTGAGVRRSSPARVAGPVRGGRRREWLGPGALAPRSVSSISHSVCSGPDGRRRMASFYTRGEPTGRSLKVPSATLTSPRCRAGRPGRPRAGTLWDPPNQHEHDRSP